MHVPLASTEALQGRDLPFATLPEMLKKQPLSHFVPFFFNFFLNYFFKNYF